MTGQRARRRAVGTQEGGATLLELLVAMGLASLLSVLMLGAVQGQMAAFERSDQILGAQQNARSGLGFVERLVRQACAGAPVGSVGVNLPGAPQRVASCLRVIDGAQPLGGSFTEGDATSLPDALEILTAGPPVTVTTGAAVLSNQPQVDVADASALRVGDLVLLGDGQQGVLLQVSAMAPGAGGGTTLRFGTLGGPVVSPQVPALGLGVGSAVSPAQWLALYVSTAPGRTLMLDPNGPLGTDHGDAQPLAEGVEDLQIAVGMDGNGDGVLPEDPSRAGADEWLGNAIGELPLPSPPWNLPATPQPRLVRITVLCRTGNTYPGSIPAPGPYEDRSVYPATAATQLLPRYRALRVSVAPRAFYLNE